MPPKFRYFGKKNSELEFHIRQKPLSHVIPMLPMRFYKVNTTRKSKV